MIMMLVLRYVPMQAGMLLFHFANTECIVPFVPLPLGLDNASRDYEDAMMIKPLPRPLFAAPYSIGSHRYAAATLLCVIRDGRASLCLLLIGSMIPKLDFHCPAPPEVCCFPPTAAAAAC